MQCNLRNGACTNANNDVMPSSLCCNAVLSAFKPCARQEDHWSDKCMTCAVTGCPFSLPLPIHHCCIWRAASPAQTRTGVDIHLWAVLHALQRLAVQWRGCTAAETQPKRYAWRGLCPTQAISNPDRRNAVACQSLRGSAANI